MAGPIFFFLTIDWEPTPPTGKQLVHREYLFMPNAAYRAAHSNCDLKARRIVRRVSNRRGARSWATAT